MDLRKFSSHRKVLERYEKKDDKYVVSIWIRKMRDLFRSFDRSSSFIKRDLDYEFAEYLYESATELDGKPFFIRLDIHEDQYVEEMETKVYSAIDNYFEYEINLLKKRRRRILSKVAIHMILALSCISLSYTLTKYIKSDSYLHTLFVESIIIAAWVFMWPVFSDFIYELIHEGHSKKIYQRIIDADITFNYNNSNYSPIKQENSG